MSTNVVREGVVFAAQKTNINLNQVIAVLGLIIEEQCTVPFISRYRKERTGGLDEVQIREVHEAYEEHLEIEKRRAYILDTIKKMEKMTPELEKKILAANNLNTLEDIYAPYKSKKKTKAQLAIEAGLKPLADLLLVSPLKLGEIEKQHGTEFAGKHEKFPGFKECLMGATDILVEMFAHDTDIKELIRKDYWDNGKFISSKKEDAEKEKDYLKFKDFFEFEEPLKALTNPKNSHRYLAMRRGMTLKILKLDISSSPDYAMSLMRDKYFPNEATLGCADIVKKCAQKAYDYAIHSSLDLELKTELKKLADEAAIKVFGANLKNLLLQPYLGSKAVMAIDPGIRTGCKVVLINATGKFIGDFIIYPFEPRNDVVGSATLLNKAIELHNIEYVAIGNGTAGRESLEFVERHVTLVKEGKVKATIISEAGASVYSASDIAREEFPDKDVTVRGAVSIGRRFQDPLAELVKIDPKSIGVGQYQHDVNQIKLKKSLEGVVENCVNYVGVDINTASAPLLAYISGIGAGLAKNIVKYRDEHRGFKSRRDIMEVPRFSQKIFEQSAGFLRIYNGPNPLDSTFIHPERYPVLVEWVKKHNKGVKDLVIDKDLIDALARDTEFKKEVGDMTHEDIVKSLRAPSQDPRTEFKSVEFHKDLKDLNDVKPGSWYTGVVNNITNFGAFVDIGIKESGLIHVSEMSDQFVEDALDVLKVGQEVKVKVLDIDTERRRISLSMKSDSDVNYDSKKQGTARPAPARGNGQNKGAGKPFTPPREQKISNNAFAALKGLKLGK